MYVRSLTQSAEKATDEQGARLVDNLQWGVGGEFFPNVSKRERTVCKYLRAEAAGGKRRLTLEQPGKVSRAAGRQCVPSRQRRGRLSGLSRHFHEDQRPDAPRM